MKEKIPEINRSEPIYTIGEVAKMTGVTKARLNDYDKKGILVPSRAKKDVEQDWRLYSEEDIDRLEKIDVLLAYGFLLKEIKQILDDEIDFLEALDAKILELKQQENHLQSLVLFAKFVDLHDDDIFEGLIRGPQQIDEIINETLEEVVYQDIVKEMLQYSEPEKEKMMSKLKDIIQDFMSTNKDGISCVEKQIDRFFAWWEEYITHDENCGFLEFWAIFENDTTIVSEVEKIGGEIAAADLQMWAFYVKMKRLMLKSESVIREISEFAKKDMLLAIAKSEGLVDMICETMGADPRNRDDGIYKLCVFTLERMRRIWADIELRALLEIEDDVYFFHEDFEICEYVLMNMMSDPEGFSDEIEQIILESSESDDD